MSTSVQDSQNTEGLPEPHPEERDLPRPLRPSTPLSYLERGCPGTPLSQSSPTGWLGGEYLRQRYIRHTVVRLLSAYQYQYCMCYNRSPVS